jgi:hypothetical protein
MAYYRVQEFDQPDESTATEAEFAANEIGPHLTKLSSSGRM